MSEPDKEVLWARLSAAGLTAGEAPHVEVSHVAWYIRVMLCIAGLIAATCLFAFVGVAFRFLVESSAGSTGSGLALIASAYALFRAARHSDFGTMFALSTSFAGQALLLFGLSRLFGPH